MKTTSRSLSHGLAGVPRNAEEARSFLQRRIRLFAGIIWGLSGGFYLTSHLLNVFASSQPTPWFLPEDVAHLAATSMPFGVWALCYLRRWGLVGLAALDAVGIIATGAAFAWMGSRAPANAENVFPMILATTHVCFARSVLIPSSARRTLWIHSLVFVPGVVARYFQVQAVYPEFAFLAGASVGLWDALALVLTTVTSWVIYGLRERVRETLQLGQYTLDEKIGEGGMGVVYRASHAMLRRPTAIKLLRADQTGEKNLARFEREVQITSRLTHPNTLAIYDFGRTPDGAFYYAMEYLDGVTLEELVDERGPQPAARTIHLLRQITGALAEAHRAGLIHRDIKPANIILCERGGVLDVAKVLDFGLVKELVPEGANDAAMTHAGTITGTPHFMSPESIVAPEKVGPASDIYALGATAYFLLTGENVFGGATLVQVLANQLHGVPELPSAKILEKVPADLEAIVMRCLAKEANDRPESAAALETELASCADAGAWSQEKAKEWWPLRSKDPAEKRRRIESAKTSPVTVAIDLRERGLATRDVG